MTQTNVVVVGANRLGCRFALSAKALGMQVTLIDEHPQTIQNMSFDAPYFYGAHLPPSLNDELAVLDNVINSNDLLMECIEADVDVKAGAVAWGIFQNGPNALHAGPARLGYVADGAGAFVRYDHLVIAGGSRDFVPSFKGWELPGVLGANAGLKLIQSYRCYYGTETIVLGSGNLAVEFALEAARAGFGIVGIVEPTGSLQCDADLAGELERQGFPVFLNRVIAEASGLDRVAGVRLISTSTSELAETIACNTLCVGISSLPNVELPASLGCEMVYSDEFSVWLPALSGGMQTSADNVYWLSKFSGDEDQVDAAIAAIASAPNRAGSGTNANAASLARDADSRDSWVYHLDRLGDDSTVLCQCESVSRSDFLGIRPPGYLQSTMRNEHKPTINNPALNQISQDQLKRMTRVGMGHCQGKRCRDEASILLKHRFGIPLKDVRPTSYRFPVRPTDVVHIAAEDEPGLKWSYWVGSTE